MALGFPVLVDKDPLVARVLGLSRVNEAAVVRAPDFVLAGETFVVELRVENRGTAAWTPAAQWLATLTAGWSPRGVRLLRAVQPGEQITLAFEVTPPGPPGVQSVRWQMAQIEGEGFGDVAEVELEVVTAKESFDGAVHGGCAASQAPGLAMWLSLALLLFWRGGTRQARTRPT